MARTNKAANAMKKQKEARQKKVLIGLLPVLLILMVWQGPGMLSAFTGGSAEPPPVLPPEGSTGATGTAPAAPTGQLDPATGAAPTTAAPGTSAAVEPAVPASLPETGDTVAPGPGQLVSFDRFLGKDPFRPQVVPKDTTGGGAPAAGGGADGGGGGGQVGVGAPPPGGGGSASPPAPPPPAAPPSTYDAAVIDVNGQQQTVSKRGTFPSFDPVFRLRAIRRASIEFGLVSGEFTAGQNRIVVRAGESVTLVSEPDGQRFVVRLVAVD